MQVKTVELDGKRVAYTDETIFLVEIGKGRGKYKTAIKCTGNIHEAVRYYRAVNIGNGYKKRLRAPSFNKPLLARAFS